MSYDEKKKQEQALAHTTYTMFSDGLCCFCCSLDIKQSKPQDKYIVVETTTNEWQTFTHLSSSSQNLNVLFVHSISLFDEYIYTFNHIVCSAVFHLKNVSICKAPLFPPFFVLHSSVWFLFSRPILAFRDFVPLIFFFYSFIDLFYMLCCVFGIHCVLTFVFSPFFALSLSPCLPVPPGFFVFVDFFLEFGVFVFFFFRQTMHYSNVNVYESLVRH